MKQKFRQNVAAIETLRQIEGENRAGTPAEQAILVKYVGWGGMPQVFAEVPPGDWREEHAQVAQLLRKEEFAAARASTLNAHYTAPEVIRAMYAAVERLGFQGGRILEPSCGAGHFIGLMPETMHARSPVTGIELDSITARLAQKLYPDSDILMIATNESSTPPQPRLRGKNKSRSRNDSPNGFGRMTFAANASSASTTTNSIVSGFAPSTAII